MKPARLSLSRAGSYSLMTGADGLPLHLKSVDQLSKYLSWFSTSSMILSVVSAAITPSLLVESLRHGSETGLFA